MLSVGQVLQLGAGAARRQGWMLVPVSLSIGLSRLLGMVPALFFAAYIWRGVLRSNESDPALAAVSKVIDALSDPSVLMLTAGGSLLAGFGAVLLTFFVDAGVVRQLAAQIGKLDAADDSEFSRGILESSTNALATGLVAALLRLVALSCGIGSVIVAMSFFTQRPGVLAAFLMALATMMLVLIPTLVAALEVGFVRAVLLEEGPFAALGAGISQAFRQSGVLIPVWFVLVLAGTATIVIGNVFSGTVNALPSRDHLWVLLLGPRGFIWLLGVVLSAMVTMWKLGSYASLVMADAGTLPEGAIARREEVILQAVPVTALPVASIVNEPGEDEDPPPTPDEASE